MTTTCCTVFIESRQGHEQRQQRPVGEDDLVLGVVGDVGQLLGEQPDVQRVQHPPGARRGEVQLHVPGGVPRERADPAVGADAEGVQHAAEPPGAVRPLRVRDPRDAGRAVRGDRPAAEVLLGVPEDRVDRQGEVLRRPAHGGMLPAPGPAIQGSSGRPLPSVAWPAPRPAVPPRSPRGRDQPQGALPLRLGPPVQGLPRLELRPAGDPAVRGPARRGRLGRAARARARRPPRRCAPPTAATSPWPACCPAACRRWSATTGEVLLGRPAADLLRRHQPRPGDGAGGGAGGAERCPGRPGPDRRGRLGRPAAAGAAGPRARRSR